MVSAAKGATATAKTAAIPPPTANTTAAAANMVAFGHKISTVVPGTATAEGVERRLSGMDLALKLHYIRGVYLYEPSDVVAQIDIQSLKAPMFTLLNAYYPVSGRIRSGNKISDRPFLKCNDCGVRIVEAKSEIQIHQLVNDHSRRLIQELEPQQVIGPQLQFSPLVFIQFTRFKCGGLAVGFSWPHVLGDAVSVARFFDAWANLIAQGKQPRLSMPEGQEVVAMVNNSELQLPSSFVVMESHQLVSVSSIKQVDPTTECWVVPAELQNKKMESLTFNITDVELNELLRKIGNVAGEFEAICAVIWRCLVNVRANVYDSVVTICRPASTGKNSRRPYLGNRQTIRTARYTSINSSAQSIKNGNLLSELARLIAGEGARDETQAIEDHVDASKMASGMLVLLSCCRGYHNRRAATTGDGSLTLSWLQTKSSV